jgi:hypothetical protein
VVAQVMAVTGAAVADTATLLTVQTVVMVQVTTAAVVQVDKQLTAVTQDILTFTEEPVDMVVIGILLVIMVVMVTVIMAALTQQHTVLGVLQEVVVAHTEPRVLPVRLDLLVQSVILETQVHRAHKETLFKIVQTSDSLTTDIRPDQLYKRLKKTNEHSLSNCKSRSSRSRSCNSLLDR